MTPAPKRGTSPSGVTESKGRKKAKTQRTEEEQKELSKKRSEAGKRGVERKKELAMSGPSTAASSGPKAKQNNSNMTDDPCLINDGKKIRRIKLGTTIPATSVFIGPSKKAFFIERSNDESLVGSNLADSLAEFAGRHLDHRGNLQASGAEISLLTSNKI